MIRAILIDDEVHCLDTLSILLNDFCPGVEIVERCLSPKQGLAAIQKHDPALVFLDIEMPSMNGFELLEYFKTIPFAVIFTTSYDQYAIKAIRFSALDYLLKPIDPKELIIAVNKVNLQKYLPATEQFRMLIDRVKIIIRGFKKLLFPPLKDLNLFRQKNWCGVKLMITIPHCF